MRIAHISDLHIHCGPAPGLLRPDTRARVQALVRDLLACAPDVVAVTGDLTHDGNLAEHALLHELLAPLTMPVLLVPGNHDIRLHLRATFPGHGWADPDFLHCEAIHHGLRFLALDTLAPGEVGGRLCPARLGWLRDRLAQPFDGQTFFLMHHPPCPTRLGVLDHNRLIEGGPELGRLIAAMPRPPVLLCGHMHVPFQAIWQGALVCVAGSPAFEYAALLEGCAEPPLTAAPFGYALHLLDGDHTIHRRLPAL